MKEKILKTITVIFALAFCLGFLYLNYCCVFLFFIVIAHQAGPTEIQNVLMPLLCGLIWGLIIGFNSGV